MDFQRSPSVATARPSMEQSPLAGNGSPDDSKKSRIAKACETCRKKKIKCDGRTPSCTNCADHSRECVYRVAEQKRARPKGARYIETLEKRLERIEGLLAKKVSGALPVDPSVQTPVTSRRQRSETVNSHSHSPSNSNLEKPLPATPGEISAYSTANSSPNVRDPGSEEEPTEEEIEKLTERFFLLTNALGESKFIGSSSSFSIFSPNGIEWINEKTGDTGIQDIITSTSADSTRFHPSVPDIFGDLFQRSIFEPLPPKQQCLSLLEDFFRDFNSIMPLFHQPTFMHLVERQYSANPYGGSGWWASLNLALAISSRLTLRGTSQSDADRRARGYLKNAMAVLAELIVQNADLLSVQAMVGMSLYMHCEANPEPSYNLVAAAIRVSYSIGLHKSGSAFNFNPAESEQRKRVFWIAYILDKEISLRMGRPPAQEDTDMSVELPNLEPEDNVGTVLQGGTKYNIFRLLAEFATIQSRLYKQLYSTEAAKQPIEKLLTTVGELDSELAEWKARIPKQADSAACTPVDMHILMLQFGYYNCLATIHRMTGAWLSRLSGQTVEDLKTRITNLRVFSSAGICVAAARDSIRLLKYVPREDNAALWLIMYYPIASLITLFTGILQNPQASESQTDLELMSVVMDYVSILCEKGDAPFTQARSVCAEFQRMAKLVVEKQAQQKSSTGHNSTAPTNNPHPPVTPMNKIQPSASPQPVNRQIPGVLSPTMSYEMHGWADRTGATSLNHDITGETSWANNLVPTDHMMPLENGLSAFDDMESLHNRLSIGSLSNAANLNSFQQSFIPQDLLNMPMDLDWDWVDTLGGYPGFENGQFGNGSMNN